MTLRTDSRTAAFCDWLDATAPPAEEHRLRSELGPMLCAAGALKLSDDHYQLGEGGTVKMGVKYGTFRVSFSGAAIAMLKLHGYWESALFELGAGPHRVTRLDAAVDFPMDGADAIAALLDAYPRGEVRLGQRPIRTSEYLNTRPDGRKTGTWYAGDRRKAEVTARVYDKAWQLLDKRGEVVPPRTRAELTVRKGVGPTLRDAAEPERIFWHYMAPSVLERPEGVPEWTSGWAEGWSMERVEILPAQALKRRIEQSPELAALVELADAAGPHGRSMALRLIEQKIRRSPGAGSRTSSVPASGSGGS